MSNVIPFPGTTEGPASAVSEIERKFKLIINLNDYRKPPTWLCDRVQIAEKTVNIFAGYGCSKKTMLTQYIALCISHGIDLFGRFPVTRAKVLHLDYEQGEDETVYRYQRMARNLGITLDQEWLKMSSENTFKLDDKCAESQVKLALQDSDAKLVIIDSLRASVGDLEENSSKIRKPIDMVGNICKANNASVIFITHAKKPSENERRTTRFSIRGSSAIFDSCDSALVFNAEPTGITIVESAKRRLMGRPVDLFGIDVFDVIEGTDHHWGLGVSYIDQDENDAVEQRFKKNAEEKNLGRMHDRFRNFFLSLPDRTFVGKKTDLSHIIGGKHATNMSYITLLVTQGKIVHLKTNESWIWSE